MKISGKKTPFACKSFAVNTVDPVLLKLQPVLPSLMDFSLENKACCRRRATCTLKTLEIFLLRIEI